MVFEKVNKSPGTVLRSQYDSHFVLYDLLRCSLHLWRPMSTCHVTAGRWKQRREQRVFNSVKIVKIAGTKKQNTTTDSTFYHLGRARQKCRYTFS